MENVINNLKYFVALLGTGFTWLFGAWDLALGVLIAFMFLDYGTGLVKAYITKTVSSSAGARGIAKKTMIFAVVIVGVLLDRLLNTGTWVFRTVICYFFIANEGISILENCSAIGLPIPAKLQEALAQLRKDNDEGLKVDEKS